MNLPEGFKENVAKALLAVRSNFTGSNAMFAKQWGINGAVWSRIKNGEREGVLRDTQWLTIGRQLNVSINQKAWNAARTEVFEMISEDIEFCRKNSASKMFVDDCGIGKTFTAKYLSRKLQNCFYVDASQCKTRHLFTRVLAKTIGVDATGRLQDVKEDVKFYLKTIPEPIIIVDEAGDLDNLAFLDLKEYWNATEDACGWYLMGAEGLREYIRRGMRSKKVGFDEVFSRFSEKYSVIVPNDQQQKIQWYKKLITDIVSVNSDENIDINEIVRKSLIKHEDGKIGGVRRAKQLLKLHA